MELGTGARVLFVLGKCSTTDTVSPRRPGYPNAPALASWVLGLQICHDSSVTSCCLCIPALRLPDIPSILTGNPAELATARLFHVIRTALPYKEETPLPMHLPHMETEPGLRKRPAPYASAPHGDRTWPWIFQHSSPTGIVTLCISSSCLFTELSLHPKPVKTLPKFTWLLCNPHGPLFLGKERSRPHFSAIPDPGKAFTLPAQGLL